MGETVALSFLVSAADEKCSSQQHCVFPSVCSSISEVADILSDDDETVSIEFLAFFRLALPRVSFLTLEISSQPIKDVIKEVECTAVAIDETHILTGTDCGEPPYKWGSVLLKKGTVASIRNKAVEMKVKATHKLNNSREQSCMSWQNPSRLILT